MFKNQFKKITLHNVTYHLDYFYSTLKCLQNKKYIILLFESEPKTQYTFLVQFVLYVRNGIKFWEVFWWKRRRE